MGQPKRWTTDTAAWDFSKVSLDVWHHKLQCRLKLWFRMIYENQFGMTQGTMASLGCEQGGTRGTIGRRRIVMCYQWLNISDGLCRSDKSQNIWLISQAPHRHGSYCWLGRISGKCYQFTFWTSLEVSESPCHNLHNPIWLAFACAIYKSRMEVVGSIHRNPGGNEE